MARKLGVTDFAPDTTNREELLDALGKPDKIINENKIPCVFIYSNLEFHFKPKINSELFMVKNSKNNKIILYSILEKMKRQYYDPLLDAMVSK